MAAGEAAVDMDMTHVGKDRSEGNQGEGDSAEEDSQNDCYDYKVEPYCYYC